LRSLFALGAARLFPFVEKDGAHRVFAYVGRTTPKARDGNKWKDLDARSVYNW